MSSGQASYTNAKFQPTWWSFERLRHKQTIKYTLRFIILIEKKIESILANYLLYNNII